MVSIIWKSPEHKQRFSEGINMIDDGYVDSCFKAAIYILSADYHMWEQAKQYVNHDSIAFAKMIHGMDLTHGTYVLVHLAYNLFDGNKEISPVEIAIGGLDESNYQLAISAIHVRHYDLHGDNFK